MPKLLKEITRLGDDTFTLSDILFYDSNRSPQQYKQIRKHPICKLGMGYLKTNLPDVPFVVHCEDEEIKTITEVMFKKIWRKMIYESLEKLEFGFKCCEILYEVGVLKYEFEEEQKAFEGLLLRVPRGVDAETITPNGILIERDGDLRGFMQDNDSRRQVLVSDRKCLLFVNQYESGNWYGFSEYENIYQAWYDSNLNRQFGMRWLERKGTGHYVGRYPQGKTKIDGTEQENADIMLTLLNSIMEGSTIALPSDRYEDGEFKWNIELLNDVDKTNSFIAKDDSLDSRILRGLVIPEKALTQGEVGARASIEAFQDIFVQRKQDILDTSVESINDYLVPAFIIPNFGPDVEVRIEAGQLSDDAKLKASEIVMKLAEKGAIEVDKDWLEKKSGVPFEIVEVVEEPEPEEEEIEEDEDEEEIEDEDVEEEIKDEKGKKKKDEKKEKKKLSDVKLASKRQENEIESNYGLSDFGGRMDEAEAILIEALTANLMAQQDRIVSLLEKRSQDPKFINVVDDIKINQGQIKRIIKEYGEQIYSGMFTNLEKGTGGTLNLAEPPKKFIGFRASLSTNKLITDLESELKFAISNAMNNEASKNAIINIPKTIFPAFIDKRIPTLAQTETGFFFNQAGNDFVRINKKLVKSGKIPPEQEIKRMIYSAILDGKTTELCRELDGTIAEVGSPIIQKYNPPLHFNCRSTWLPLTEEQIANNPVGLELTMGKNGKPIKVDEVTTNLGNKPINKKGTKSALDEITFKTGG